MSAIKDGRYSITLDRQRHLLFNLNVLDELEDKAGGIENLGEFMYPNEKPNFKNLKWLLTLLINEGADESEEPVTEKQVGKMIHMGNFEEVITAVYKSCNKGMSGNETPETADEDEDIEEGGDEKNKRSGQSQ